MAEHYSFRPPDRHNITRQWAIGFGSGCCGSSRASSQPDSALHRSNASAVRSVTRTSSRHSVHTHESLVNRYRLSAPQSSSAHSFFVSQPRFGHANILRLSLLPASLPVRVSPPQLCALGTHAAPLGYQTPSAIPAAVLMAGLCCDSRMFLTTALSWALLRLNPRVRLSPPFCFVGSPGRFLHCAET
jgi:hypothetical protein